MKNMLGRVAQGAKRFGEHVVGEATKVAEEAEKTESEVEALLQRLSGASIQPAYRREAMGQLRDMLVDNPKAQLAFGSMGGVPLLMSVLQDDRDDADLMRGALECFVHAMRQPRTPPTPAHPLGGPPPGAMPTAPHVWSCQSPGNLQGQGPPAHPYQQLLAPHLQGLAPGATQAIETQAAAINAELLARRQENVLLLLALLEDEPVGIDDFYVRYHTVQLLTVLLQACAFKLQDAILSSRGVVRLMDMLAEREVIRNESLVLLVALTHANAEVQKIAAFEGAFDRVFHIVKEEGGTDGGVVVQDCLALLNNLLRANVANQRLFREMGYVAALAQLLSTAAPARIQEGPSFDRALQGLGAGLEEAAGIPISQQKAAILLCALETVMLLATPVLDASGQPVDQPSTQASVDALLKHGVLEALLPLCLTDGGVTSPAVSAQALAAVAGLVSANRAGQERLGACMVPPRPGSTPIPALQAALHVALHSTEHSKRGAAESVIQGFCFRNPEGQAALASTLMPTARGSAGLPSTFGAELAAALQLGPAGAKAALEVSCRAASVLQHLLAGNDAGKERLLQVPLEMPASPTAPTELLLPKCFRLLSQALASQEPAGHASALLLLRLLLVWLHESPPAIAHMVAHAGHLPLLVDAVVGRVGVHSPLVQGLAAVILGTCLLHGQAPAQQQQQKLVGQVHAQPSAPPSDLVFDVLVARVGLSQFIAKLDDLNTDPVFVAASCASGLPHQVTRAYASVATATASPGANDALPHNKSTSSTSSSTPHPSSAPGHTNSSHGSFPLDHAFTVFVRDLEAQIRQHITHLFARPRAPSGRHVAASTQMELLALLPGVGDTDKLRAAADALLQLGQTADELLAQKNALSQDLARAAQQQQQQQQQQSRLSTCAASQSQAASDAEAKTQAELRATRAETELATVRQQVELLSARLAQAEQDAASAQEASATSFSQATKYEGDLSVLGDHCRALESQIRELQNLLSFTQQQLQQQQQAPATQGGVTEAEVTQRVEEAVAKALEKANAENEEQLTDLLVCLGQEEQKVTALSEKLSSCGVDVEVLLSSLQPEGEEEGGDDDLR